MPAAVNHMPVVTLRTPYSTAATATSSAALPVIDTVGPATVELGLGPNHTPVGFCVSTGAATATLKFCSGWNVVCLLAVSVARAWMP